MKLENCEIKRYGGAFLTAPEAAQLLHISTSHAYKIIHRLNQELKSSSAHYGKGNEKGGAAGWVSIKTIRQTHGG